MKKGQPQVFVIMYSLYSSVSSFLPNLVPLFPPLSVEDVWETAEWQENKPHKLQEGEENIIYVY